MRAHLPPHGRRQHLHKDGELLEVARLSGDVLHVLGAELALPGGGVRLALHLNFQDLQIAFDGLYMSFFREGKGERANQRRKK